MKKVRKDGKGMLLHKGETYLKKKKLYCFSYMDVLGKRRFIYSDNLLGLRKKEDEYLRNKLDKLDTYVIAKADINYVFDKYFSTKTELRSTTKTHYSYIYNKYIRNGFGKKKIADVHYTDVFCFYKGLLDRGVGISSVREMNKLLSSTFKFALRDNVIRSNPTIGIMPEIRKKSEKTSGIRHALTIEQEREFLDILEEPEYSRWKPLFTFMFGTGCRIGEVIGLRWCDVDFNKEEININHSITYGPRVDKKNKVEFEVNMPKTEAGIRIIPMMDKVKEALLLEKKNQAESGSHSIVEIGGLSDFIFCNRFGGILNVQSVNSVLHRIVDKYNALEEDRAKKEDRESVPLPRFSCHITRHTFCARLCENEINIKVIQTIMGHRDIQTTLNIYAEVSEMKKKETFKDLNNDKVF